jgi:oxidase EvaA
MTVTPNRTRASRFPLGAQADRFTASALAADGLPMPNARIGSWLAERRRACAYDVRTIPFDELVGWRFKERTGDLVHESGKFFSVVGLRVDTDRGWDASWAQPVISQPEVGILGILVKEFDGIVHFLMQAKMEPGNVNTIQLSPTVQATRSNYTGVHRGRGIPFIEYFTPDGDGRVLVDALQSEQGAWFLNKRNRNVIVEVTGDVPEHEDFCWLTLGQIRRLLHEDNLVNMNSRSILAGLGFAPSPEDTGSVLPNGLREGMLNSLDDTGSPLCSLAEIRSRLTEVKARRELLRQLIPLKEVARWTRRADRIEHDDGKYFRVIAAETTASSREVSHWTQPLLAPAGRGMSALFVRMIGDTLYLLMRAQVEAGLIDVAEFGPTVQYTPHNYRDVPAQHRPPFADLISATPPERILYDTVLSEEGGRFYQAESRYLVALLPDDFPIDIPEDFTWMTLNQATELIRYSYHFSIQARTLITACQSCW